MPSASVEVSNAKVSGAADTVATVVQAPPPERTCRVASVGPRPAKPLDIWLGGSAPAGLRRVGRLADGWLGSLLTPEEARDAVAKELAADKKAAAADDTPKFASEAKWELAGYNSDEVVYTVFVTSQDTRIPRVPPAILNCPPSTS